MSKNDKLAQMQAQLLSTFLEESFDGLERVEAGLLALEGNEAPLDTLNDIFRAAHSIKGSAGTFGLTEVTGLAHAMEALLDYWRNGAVIDPTAVQLVLSGVDGLTAMLTAVQHQEPVDGKPYAELKAALLGATRAARASLSPPKMEAMKSLRPAAVLPSEPRVLTTWGIDLSPKQGVPYRGVNLAELFAELAEYGELSVTAKTDALPSWQNFDPMQCYVSFELTLESECTEAKLRDLLSWSDDCELKITALCQFDLPDEPSAAVVIAMPPLPTIVGAPVVAAASTPAVVQKSEPQPVATKAAAAAEKANAARESAMSSIRVGVEKIDTLMNMVGELVITQSMLGELDQDGELDQRRIERIREGLTQLARNTRSLQESVMRMRSTPVSTVFNRFPRLVHDLSSRLGKDIELKCVGETTELDRTVLDKLGDPLVHLVRNSLDHGLEGPEERAAAGKPRAGTLRLSAQHRGGDVIIEVEDDGRGIDPVRVLEKARSKGLVAEDAVMSDSEIRYLIFAPGFSTADQVSDISGRGVGMDVVRRNIKELGGDLQLESTTGKGTKITLRLPLTLAIVDGQLVRVGENTYVIPLLSIVESTEIAGQRINKLEGKAEVYRFREEYIPVVNLRDILHASGGEQGPQELMVVVDGDGQRMGLRVDELLGQQQVVIKSLEANFRRVPGLAGATILGDGNVALIIDAAQVAGILRDSGMTARTSAWAEAAE